MKFKKFELSEKEQYEIRHGVETVVLGLGNLAEGVKSDVDSYLHLIKVSEVAYQECEWLLSQAVRQARRTGHSWVDIGKVLGISRQAAQQRWGEKNEAPVEDTDRVIMGATAFNEMRLLDQEGRKGFHLVSFGPLYLVLRKSDVEWEHLRLTPIDKALGHRAPSEEGWQYVGSWFPFQYFKREKPVQEE